jgi:hypothetical protein
MPMVDVRTKPKDHIAPPLEVQDLEGPSFSLYDAATLLELGFQPSEHDIGEKMRMVADIKITSLGKTSVDFRIINMSLESEDKEKTFISR